MICKTSFSTTTAAPAAMSQRNVTLPNVASSHTRCRYEDMKAETDFVKSNPEAAALSVLAASVTSVDRKSLAFDAKVDNLQYLKSKFGTLDDEPPDALVDSSKQPLNPKKSIKSAPDAAAAADAAAHSNSIPEKPTKNRKSGVQLVDAQEAGSSHNDDSAVHDQGAAEAAAPEPSPHDIIKESGRLFLRNCSFSMSEKDLQGAFSVYGDVVDAHVCIDKRTKKPTGMAFVTFMMPRDAVKAFDALNGTPLCGRILHILPALANQTAEKDTSHLSYKEKKALKEKAEAENGHNWNALFMKNDAVAAAVSSRLGIEKTEFLDHEVSSSLAVRMALGETHVVSETKTQLLQDGVNVSVLENASKKTPRSNTVILIKNISHECNAEELRRLFSKHGDIVRVVLPATRTIALIEFHHSNEAKAAFRCMAYTRLYDTPLFLEWAPEGIFDGPPASALPPPAAVAAAASSTAAAATQSGGTVFVKNLSFSTTSERLRQHCENLGISTKAASIVTHKGGEKNGQSRGYGFVEFESPAAAARMLAKLHGSKLDGHALEAKLSTRAAASFDEPGLRSSSASIQSQANTKLVLKNVPFEATKKELYELFKPFGQLKTLRLPRKFDGNHRGFAFVDFLTAGEAENALKVLKHTHFYGRHLVIAPAKDDESLETLRLKTAKHFDALRDGTKSKRTRVEEALEEEDTGSSDLDE
jgi:multiple RNA-binding domain-containing protein 1